MFAVRGSAKFASKLQEALISAAQSDDFRANRGSHDSGWGGVWYSEREEKYYRTTTPIFEDPKSAQFFDQNDPIVGLSHARLKAEGEPVRGPYDSHPFEAHFGEELVYLSHNGHIDKYKLAERVGVADASKLNDSEVFAFLLEKTEGKSTMERLENAIEFVRKIGAMEGALNLMVMSMIRGGKKKIYYHCDYLNETKELYYSLYTFSENGDLAVMSSTVAYKLGLIDLTGIPRAPKVLKCERKRVLTL
jgi:predicted glutamine amidotransferase